MEVAMKTLHMSFLLVVIFVVAGWTVEADNVAQTEVFSNYVVDEGSWVEMTLASESSEVLTFFVFNAGTEKEFETFFIEQKNFAGETQKWLLASKSFRKIPIDITAKKSRSGEWEVTSVMPSDPSLVTASR